MIESDGFLAHVSQADTGSLLREIGTDDVLTMGFYRDPLSSA